MIVAVINYLIRFENHLVSHHWLIKFLERNLDKLLTEDCKQNYNVQGISNYFEKVESVIKEKMFTDLDVWKIDETSFQIDFEKILKKPNWY